MKPVMTDNSIKAKARLRRRAYDARRAQVDKDKVSEVITQKIINLSVYQQATTIMWYLHCRSEVRTLGSVTRQLNFAKQIAVPYCTQDQQGVKQLGLWHLTELSDLVSGTWGILEPPEYRWQELEKMIAPETLDIVLVPGVAFSTTGARLGNGQGYYDRLLNKVSEDCLLIGVGFQCQVFDSVPMADNDVYLDYVMTEQNLYQGVGRK